MRKLFAATFGIAAMLSLVVGVAFAWTADSGLKIGQAPIGELSVNVANVAGTGNALYPTGSAIRVLNGAIKNNTATNPGINVMINASNPGSVIVTGFQGNTSHCSTGLVSGDIVMTGGGQVAPGGNVGGGWAIDLSMDANAEDGCQGADVYFDYIVNVTTP